MRAAFRGHGIDLKPEHYASVQEHGVDVDWVEVISERFLSPKVGARLAVLEMVRREVPVALHGLALSIGSVDPLREEYLSALADLADRIEPMWVSDHLAWASWHGADLDLLPLPYTEEALVHVVRRVLHVQERLGRRILLENPSTYLRFRDAEMTEWKFLSETARRADCGILLDVNNLYVCARNHGFDPADYLAALPKERVCQLHLAGHHDAGSVVLDTHEGPVPASVWALYRQTIRSLGPVPTIVEWDTGIPPLDVVAAESRRAAAVEREVTLEAGPDPGATLRVPLQ